ncbi:hypothetical protein [Actinophytocola sp.]|uniref:hypothetical protein n=1 Tax=Actinophytocola sp. TaxID=1872138 RepID=UPI002D28CAAA|nr:hypothetical protein [Actinophytocola sp.]HYQ68296.1 hypothetical protein [Actinophytocola sp.]
MTETVWDISDPARGRRRVTLGDGGLPERIDLADGTSLRVDRDEQQHTMSVTDGTGTRLVHLRTSGWTEATRRLSAHDPAGVTTADVSDTTARLERDGAVLRVDSDVDGRPARVTLPGCAADLVYRATGAGCWAVGPLGDEPLLRIVSGPTGVSYDLGAGLGWTEQHTARGVTTTDLGGTPIVDVITDPAGRIDGRRWHGGKTWRYERDDRSRVTAWTDGTTRTERRYRGLDLAEIVVAGRRTVVRGDGGRITRLTGPSGTVTYDHDPAGRRVRRECRGVETHYTYDPLGQLTSVHTGDSVARYGWDALGRRVWTERDGVRYHEHRDATGRLWSVTGDGGRLVHAFIWWDGRVVARLDATGALDEAYLTDPVGTLMGVLTVGDGRFTEAVQPPFGMVTAPWRPTLFGHIGDGATPLICFGARDLDPETGQFLTPDPWHGGLDDPRHIAGQSTASLALAAEAPVSGIHPYALSHGDPLSRPDLDGHFAWLNSVLTLFLAPTWGFPLTSLSVFLFAPLNVYGEIAALIYALFAWRHPWKHHSIFNSRIVSGSSRLGTVALALNGLLPRIVGGFGGDRCVTIGHVVWENRRYFQLLDRPRVLELDDIRGTPLPDGRPSGDARKFSDAVKGSVLVVTGTDKDSRKWIHGSWWTRGPGNAVGDRAGAQTFEDRVPAGTPHARGTVYLAQPLPEAIDPEDDRLSVAEYLVAGGKSSTGELVTNLWFAFTVSSDAGLSAGDPVQLGIDGIGPAQGVVAKVLPSADPVIVIDHELPARFQTPGNVGKTVKVNKLNATPTTSAGWAAGATANKSVRLAAPPHAVGRDEVYEFTPAGGAPGGRPKAYSSIGKVTATVQLSPTIAGLALGGAAIYRLTTDGTALTGNVPDPAAHADQLTVAGAHNLVVGDLITAQPTAGGAAHHARVTAVTPAVDPTPSTVTVEPAFTLAAATPVRITRLKETDRVKDLGTGAVQAGDTLAVEVRSSAVFAVGTPVVAEIGGARHVRGVAAITQVDLETVDELVGNAPYSLVRYDVAPASVDAKLSAQRFVKWVSGDRPSSYGAWPAELMGLVPTGYLTERAPQGWRFFLRATPAPPGLNPKYRDFFEPFTVGAQEYWLVTSDLKIVQEGPDFYWEPDPDDDYPRRHRAVVPNPTVVTVRSFVASGVTRPDGGGAVLAFPAETQVPDDPRVRWSLADALADHELGHTLQNTYWGPFLGALPLGGILHTVRDVVEASGEDMPGWLDDGIADRSILEILSIGSVMQLAWRYVIVAPALGAEAGRDYLLSRDFDDLSSVFNPVNQQIIKRVPRIDHDVPASRDWRLVLANFAVHALDLRSWTPFLGLIPTWLPDGSTNFIEQQASRWSGDTYSTILTADDRYNVHTRLRVTDGSTSLDANRTSQVGDAVRLMCYFESPLGRNLPLDRCDAPGTRVVQFRDWSSFARQYEFLEVEQTATAPALVHDELYEHLSGTPTTALSVDGPPSAPAPISLLRVPTGAVLRPRPRSVVPIPPHVMRAAGVYVVSASPAKWKATAFDVNAGGGRDDPRTQEVEITTESVVKLGAEDVAWSEPVATGSVPAVGTSTLVERFITETQPLTVKDRDTTNWEASGGAGVTLTPNAPGRGWTLTVSAPPATPLPHEARVRIWAKVGRTDPEIFDLHHDEVPTLAGRRSYLENDLWIPVRDFLLRIKDLPALPTVQFTAAGQGDLDLPIALPGPASIVPGAPGVLAYSRVQAVPPRGERWRFTLAGRKAVPEPRDIPVTVRFGGGAGVPRAFTVRVTPNFTLDKPPATAAYEVTPTASLTLTITGGVAPYRLETTPPSATTAKATLSGNTITLTVSASTAPTPPPVNFDLVVKDNTDKLAIRTITIKR